MHDWVLCLVLDVNNYNGAPAEYNDFSDRALGRLCMDWLGLRR